jgi:3-phytase
MFSMNAACATLLASMLLVSAQHESAAQPEPDQIAPIRFTQAVGQDADDPAIWIHPSDPGRSLILGTNKVAAVGTLAAFALDGRSVQAIPSIDRPNNVDVEYGLLLGGRRVDIAVVTERLKRRLRIFAIRHDGRPLEEVSAGGGIPVLAGQPGEKGEPMGISLYKRPRDGAVFAIVAPKTGGSVEYLWQYRLEDDGAGLVKGSLVRRFGKFSGQGAEPGDTGEIEAVAVDDELGFVYYADERFGIRKSHADPDHPDAARELAVFGTSGYQLDREGLAIYTAPGGRGYIVSTDQIPGGTEFRLYRREGESGKPHDHRVVRVARTTADATDGIEVVSTPLPGFPAGLLVAMNSSGRNFALFRWEDIAGIPRTSAPASH